MEFTSFPDSGIMTAAFYCILFGCETEAEAGKNADATIIVIVWLVWGGTEDPPRLPLVLPASST